LVAALSAHSQITPQASSDWLIHIWNSEDGLPQNSVNCLAQTPDGYLWIGTRSGGLARFDGTRFVTFNPQSTPELRDVEIETLSVDSFGTMWITAGNESIASQTDGKFRLVREPNAEPRWHPLQIHIVAEDGYAVYLAAYGNTVFRIPRNGAVNESQPIVLAPPPPDPPPGQFSQAPDGALWYVTDQHGIARMEFNTPGNAQISVFRLGIPVDGLTKDASGQFWAAAGNRIGIVTPQGFADLTPTNGLPLDEVRHIVPARDGGLWVWDDSHLRKMSGGEWNLTASQFEPQRNRGPLHFFADSQGGLWVIEYGTGLWHVGPDGKTDLLTPENGLPSKFITCWMEDNQGNIWIGTKEAGLARIRHKQFKVFTAADGIPGDVAQSVCEDAQETIWVGTATGGLARKAGEKFVSIPLTPIPDPLIESVTVCPDVTNGIWVGTLQGRVFRVSNHEVGRVNDNVTWSFPLERLRDHVANAMMQDSSDRVWICNGSGAYYYQDGTFSAFDQARGFVANIGVRAIAEGPRGTLWFGTEPGDLWQFTKDLPARHHPPADWPNARVAALLPDADGGVWIGTLGGGLLRFQNGTFTRITTQQGLPDNSITQLLEDQDGNLWGGTYAGIFRATKQDLKDLAAGNVTEIAFSVYGRFDGLPAQSYSGWFQPSCWRAHDGRLWFTTVKGLVAVSPRDVAVNRRPPPVIIEEMRLDNVLCDFNTNESSVSNAVLQIGPGRHSVEFRFTGIDFNEPDKVLCKWQLEGVDKQWRESMSQRVIGYGPLLPGSYRFRVLAANSDGVWNKTGASMAFVVLPFFWETWWFKTLLIAGICVGLALTVTLGLRRRHRFELERLERRHEMERERTRIARDMHDEIGSKLARISFLSEVVKSEVKGFNQPDGVVDSLSRTARDLLQSLDRMLWAVNPRNDSLEKLSAYLNRYAAEYFQNTPIRCRLAFSENVPAIQLSAETRHNIFLAFEEALANTLKHSAATQVSAELVSNNGTVEISVADNGRGFDVEAKTTAAAGHETGEHLGLSGMCHRLQAAGGACQITSSPGNGTIIKFVLPLPKTSA
ncbi:MAG TPA: two-component regulator propeller domain-containing protein, partial [Candidatus Acidoferrales bacterium]|nr:two-component regulator propeller domain-containing protein [Candidatus Acidoferrales bacterium]